ncbi:uncharacterized protein PgNI_09122 [Pyricularia grisea]|uniref:Uncharacterized protein n=1 Tax=Pyricularia grisea TaxID=148305 RepID=A0A6P8ATZ3_PYRGI|nr:uncharacterized protein PgNI_09122 [Pyricularia grisea]TLD05557.1 hypothetical protein PgNI_09122 [Pyricularia grisea]
MDASNLATCDFGCFHIGLGLSGELDRARGHASLAISNLVDVVVGPRNCRKSRSPLMDLLVAVRRPNRARAIVLYKSVSRIAVIKLDSRVGTKVVMKLVIEAGRAGICTLNGLALRNRNGSGGFLSIE